MHNSKTEWLKVIIFLSVFILINNILIFVICPKGNYSRNTIKEMYSQSENIDVVFAGSSYSIYGINPYIMDEELSCNTFDYSFSNHIYISTYYSLKELYKYHKPKMVVLNTDMYSYTRQEKPIAYIEVAPYLKSISTKIEYFINSSKEGNILSRLFWWRANHINGVNQIINNVKSKLDPKYINYPTDDQLDLYENHEEKYGYVGKGFVRVDSNDKKNVLDNNNLGKMSIKNTDLKKIQNKNIEYFKKIVQLCKDNDSDLILIQTPIPTYRVFCEKNYFNFSNKIGEIAKDENVDYYDFNLIKPQIFEKKDIYFKDLAHFNSNGADEFSKSFAEFLKLRISGEDMNKYFYTPDEYLKSIDYINNTWFTNKKDGSNLKLTAYSFCGSQVKPEYQFLLIDEETNEITVLRDYDTDASITIDKPSLDKYKIRVNAREKGSNAKYSRYYEEELKK